MTSSNGTRPSSGGGGSDLSRLLPPRMVLIGLGVDPVTKQIAEFISRRSADLDLSVVKFQGFMRGQDRLLVRQIEVQPGQRQPGHRPRHETVAQKRRALREYLAHNGFKELFDRVHADLRQSLPERGVWEKPGKTGISFQVNEPDTKKWKTYIGVSVGWPVPGFSVRILPSAIRWDKDAFEKLKESIGLSEGPRGGFVLRVDSEEKWDALQDAVPKFVKAVIENQSGSGQQET